ncbi:glycosyltransferase family 4 protein [Halomicrococcus gelatinilyticus]|uniref:glycosyltransferase family 4 protein n=1 Tax=Halomicrococcus gelatinilyticus TaxID=1702103 RepID=UPI002E1265C3
MPDPIFLYNDPHPVHEKMATRIDAEFVECSKGSVLDRLQAGVSHDFGDRPVLIEGGVPLLETGFLGRFGNSGPIIELAADGTLIDIQTPLQGRPYHERIAHIFGEHEVDATITVSDYIAAYARKYDRPVQVIHPFVEENRFENLSAQQPGGDGETILCVGKYRHKNGQDVLKDAMSHISGSAVAHFVGPDTENIEEGENIEAHGYVELDQFYGLMDRADLMVYPARVGAYPVAVLEAMVAATPVLTSPYVGNADIVRSLHPNFITRPEPRTVADHIEWAMERDLSKYGRQAREIGMGFEEERHLSDFENRFNKVLSELT